MRSGLGEVLRISGELCSLQLDTFKDYHIVSESVNYTGIYHISILSILITFEG